MLYETFNSIKESFGYIEVDKKLNREFINYFDSKLCLEKLARHNYSAR